MPGFKYLLAAAITVFCAPLTAYSDTKNQKGQTRLI